MMITASESVRRFGRRARRRAPVQAPSCQCAGGVHLKLRRLFQVLSALRARRVPVPATTASGSGSSTGSSRSTRNTAAQNNTYRSLTLRLGHDLLGYVPRGRTAALRRYRENGICIAREEMWGYEPTPYTSKGISGELFTAPPHSTSNQTKWRRSLGLTRTPRGLLAAM
eukprot:543660-Rhodomonas_salina.3